MNTKNALQDFAEIEWNHALKRMSKEERDLIDKGESSLLTKNRERKLKLVVIKDCLLLAWFLFLGTEIWMDYAEEKGWVEFCFALLVSLLLPILGGSIALNWCEFLRVNRSIKYLSILEEGYAASK